MAIQLRRGLQASWKLQNPVLEDGRIGIERDTGNLKVGDGSTRWNDLRYPEGLRVNQVTSKPAEAEDYAPNTVGGIRFGTEIPKNLDENEAFMLLVR